MRYLTGRSITLTHTFEQDDELTVFATDVTVVVQDAQENIVATVVADQSAAEWVANLPDFLPEGEYTATWTAENGVPAVVAVDTEGFEVVGGHLFTIGYARLSDVDLEDQILFPPADIAEKRETVELEFERITGRSYVPRTVRHLVEHDGVSTHVKIPVRDVRSIANVTGPDGAVDDSTLDVDADGFVGGFDRLPAGYYWLDVAYGLTTVPAGIRRVGVVYLRHLLHEENSAIPDRTTSYQPQDGGTYTFGNRSTELTGIPAVDSVLSKEREKIIGDIFGGF